MKTYSLTQLSDHALTTGLASAATRERVSTAELIAYIAEFSQRGLYRAAGYPSMHLYCEKELHLSADAAYKRLQVAEVVFEFPLLLDALTDGRLHLTGANLLVPHLTHRNTGELIEASSHKTKSEIAELLAARCPGTESLPLIETVPAPAAQHPEFSNVQKPSCQLAPAQVGTPTPHAKVVPLAAQRFSVHLSFGQEMQDDLRRAQELLAHQVPSGDVVQVFHRGLKALIHELEKRKYGATDRPRKSSRESENPRYIPARLRRAVRKRDQDRCTFVAHDGRRCEARRFLEFDHILEVARGGKSTPENLRLRCRAHNQLTAEQTYGAGFMQAKVEAAQYSTRIRAFERTTRGSLPSFG